MKLILTITLLLAGELLTSNADETRKEDTGAAAKEAEVNSTVAELSSNRQARYSKGDIPLLLIRPSESNAQKRQGFRNSGMTVQMMKKIRDSAGSPSESTFVLKTNDDSLSFSELLPKLGLDPSLFGFSSSGGGHQQYQHQGSSSSSSNQGGLTYHQQRPNGHILSGQFKENNNHASQMSVVKSPHFTSYSGVETNVFAPKTRSSVYFGSKPSPQFFVGHEKPSLVHRANASAHSVFGEKTKLFENAKFKNPHFANSVHNQSPTIDFHQPPTGVIEEIVIGKPAGPATRYPTIETGIGQGFNHDGAPDHRFVEYSYPPEEETQSHEAVDFNQAGQQPESNSIHDGHITTNYYVPQTINGDEYAAKQNENRKPFTPSPQLNFYIPADHESATINVNQQQEQHLGSTGQESGFTHDSIQQPEYSETEDYFLPKFNPPQPESNSNPKSSLKFSQNAGETSYFKFGTNVAEPSVKNDPRPHAFPVTESKVSYGALFRPNPNTSFNAYPTFEQNKPTVDKFPESVPVFPDNKIQPIRYHVKESEGQEYKPPSEPATVLKSAYPNHDVTNYEQIHNEYISKFQGNQRPQVPTYFQREFSSQFEAENYVKNAILNHYQHNEQQPERKPPQPQQQIKYSTGPEYQFEVPNYKKEDIPTENYPVHFDQSLLRNQNEEPQRPSIFEEPLNFNYVHQPDQHQHGEHVKPVVEVHYEDTIKYSPAEVHVQRQPTEVREPGRRPPSITRPPVELKKSISSHFAGNILNHSPPSQEPNTDFAHVVTPATAQSSTTPASLPEAGGNHNGLIANHSHLLLHSPTANRTASSNTNNPNSFNSNVQIINNSNHSSSSGSKTSAKINRSRINLSHQLRLTHYQQPPQQQQPLDPASTRNKNSVLLKSLAQNTTGTISEKNAQSGTSGFGSGQKQPNPRQRTISCERQCIRKSVTQEYDPVCGNDGKTYSNKGKLKCTQECGKNNLTMDHLGSCAQAAPQE